MTNIEFVEKDKTVMKLIRYFIIEHNYSPVVVHGVKDEIWLENLNNDHKVIRIVSNYLHNNEQLEFDLFKTNKIASSIKMKTLTFNLNMLNIYVDLSNRVDNNILESDNYIILNKESNKSKLRKYFENIDTYLNDSNETEEELFLKITNDINEYRVKENRKTEEMFAFKTPFMTISLLIIQSIIYLLLYFNVDFINDYLKNDIISKVITNFNYASIISFIVLSVLFYITASRIEKFYGSIKFLLIYITSIIVCSLGALLFIEQGYIGINGVIASMLGALFYFGARYRLYIVSLVKNMGIYFLMFLLLVNINNITPFILIFIVGTMSGVFSSMILSFKYNKGIANRINGVVLLSILISFLVYMNFYS